MCFIILLKHIQSHAAQPYKSSWLNDAHSMPATDTRSHLRRIRLHFRTETHHLHLLLALGILISLKGEVRLAARSDSHFC